MREPGIVLMVVAALMVHHVYKRTEPVRTFVRTAPKRVLRKIGLA